MFQKKTPRIQEINFIPRYVYRLKTYYSNFCCVFLDNATLQGKVQRTQVHYLQNCRISRTSNGKLCSQKWELQILEQQTFTFSRGRVALGCQFTNHIRIFSHNTTYLCSYRYNTLFYVSIS